MTTAFIILLIVVVIILLFQRDKERLGNNVQAQGGLQEKYKIFLNLLTMNDGLKIVRINKGDIVLRKTTNNIDIQLMLTQSFNQKLLINWKTVTTLNTINLNWEFPETMDQRMIFAKIFDDISNRQNQELEKLANKTMPGISDDFDNKLDGDDFLPAINSLTGIYYAKESEGVRLLKFCDDGQVLLLDCPEFTSSLSVAASQFYENSENTSAGRYSIDENFVSFITRGEVELEFFGIILSDAEISFTGTNRQGNQSTKIYKRANFSILGAMTHRI